ncbi:MAG: GNAT family N-acetyltransferase [Chloroflexota bacterium]
MSDADLCARLTLRDGRTATVRPLRADDAERLADYFTRFSEGSRRYYGPHAFDRVTAERLCANLGPDDGIRFVATLGEGDAEQIIAYMILTPKIGDGDRQRYGDALDDGRCACLAPSVADAFQSQGLGTQMGQHVLASARRLGLRQVILMGGVVAKNERARRLYERLGFRRVREFTTHGQETLLNYDMVIDLDQQESDS